MKARHIKWIVGLFLVVGAAWSLCHGERQSLIWRDWQHAKPFPLKVRLIIRDPHDMESCLFNEVFEISYEMAITSRTLNPWGTEVLPTMVNHQCHVDLFFEPSRVGVEDIE